MQYEELWIEENEEGKDDDKRSRLCMNGNMMYKGYNITLDKITVNEKY